MTFQIENKNLKHLRRSKKVKYSVKSSIKIAMLAVILTSLVITTNASANAVFVSGEVSGVWDADTVVVVNSVHVPSGETLIIEPGVEVFMLDLPRIS